MKKVFVLIVVVAALVLMLGYTFATDSEGSDGPGNGKTAQESPVEDVSYSQEELKKLVVRTDTEPKEPAEAAEQILADISDAGVEEGTEDLNTTVSRLNELCERAAKIRDAMLTARYSHSHGHVADGLKGAGNENQ